MRRTSTLDRLILCGILVGLWGHLALWGAWFLGAQHIAVGAEGRPSHWAQPLRLPGVPNLYKVSADLYRSGQPTAEGMQNLKSLGIKTVVNLRFFHSDEDKIANTGLKYEAVPIAPWAPEESQVVRFLRIVVDSNKTPVLVHCQHGSDRTGMFCAIYRIVVQGWPKAEALREMTEGGFGFHPVWYNLVRFVQQLDVEKIRKQSGVFVPEKLPLKSGETQPTACL